MSHPEQLAFFQAVVDCNPSLIPAAEIIEIGSYDVNGSVRDIFRGAKSFVGVDLTEGPGVDIVGFGHEIEHPDGSYDISVSGECFEHDPHWKATFDNMVRMTRPGGLVVFTCASHGRPEHGTSRSDVTDSPGTQSEGLDYYLNLTEEDFRPLPLDEWFSRYKFWYQPSTFDLYFTGVRSGADSTAALPQDSDVKAIRGMLPLAHRLVRLPLRVAAKVVKDEERYQNLVMPYWLFLLRRSEGSHRAARTG